ncbi:MAG: PQQ-dependent sugar dehydrogenase, partial [Anaerolineae bacterium]|nr:PQQ-dependent sugar dehydrogenase [Anaerolineae bacterium]
MKPANMILPRTRKMAVRLALTVATLLLLAACSSDSATPAPETSQPLPVATPAPATATPLPATATATATVTDSPTATEAPSDTPTATATATETPAPTDTPTPEPDVSALNLELEMVADGLKQPVLATHAGDGSGQLFIVEKGGTILALAEDGAQPQPFLDITGRVGSSSSEQGLLGLAFDPDFAANGRFFVYYTDRNGDTVISRFQASDDRATGDPGSEVVLLTQDQPAGNHNGGMLAFGPDGYLYAGLGDGG